MERKLIDISKRLDLPLSTLNRWIRQGRIPVQRKGDRAVFDASVLGKWAAKHHLSFSLDRDFGPGEADAPQESLLAAMRRGGVHYGLEGCDAASVLSSAVAVVPDLSDDTRRVLYDRLMEREGLTSTGIGKGVAIPHPRSPIVGEGEGDVITTCFLEKPVAFGAIDDKPVFILFLLMSSTVKAHLQLLSRLAFCVRHDAFIDFLKTRPDSGNLFVQVADFEKQLED